MGTSIPVKDRKRLFRNLVSIYEQFDLNTSDGLTHSKSYLKSIIHLSRGSLTRNEVNELFEADATLTSTALGHKVLAIGSDLIADKKIGKAFIDGEVLNRDLLFYFEKKEAPATFLLKVKDALTPHGNIEVMTLPGDEMFEGIYASWYMLRVKPKSVKIKERKKKEEIREFFKQRVSTFRIERMDITESQIKQCPLTNEELDMLFEIAYKFDELSENEQAEIRHRIALEIEKEQLTVKEVRERIVKAIARKGIPLKAYTDDQLYVLDNWEKYIKETAYTQNCDIKDRNAVIVNKRHLGFPEYGRVIGVDEGKIRIRTRKGVFTAYKEDIKVI